MRRTVSGEMLETIPSVTTCRAISRQSQVDNERPRSSGRSQAILTRCSATWGGKDRLAAGSGLVAEAGQAVEAVSLGPLADMSDAQAAHRGGVLQGPALFEQEQGAAPARQPNGAGAGAL